jgi:hypothetical protein
MLFFILFLFVLFEEASKLQAPSSRASPELLGSEACLLQLNPTTQQAPELAALQQQAPERESLLHCSSKLRSVRACCCNATNSGACPAPKLVAL